MRFLFTNLSIYLSIYKKGCIFILILLMSSGMLYSQTQIKYTAYPTSGYVFLQWEDGNKTDTIRYININQIPDFLSSIPTTNIANPTSIVLNQYPYMPGGVVFQEIVDGTGHLVSSLETTIAAPVLKAVFIPAKEVKLTKIGDDLVGELKNCDDESFSTTFKFVEKGDIVVGSNTHTVSYEFYIGETEVTQELWKAVMGCGNNPSHWKGSARPVEVVSWYDVLVFCNRLSDAIGVDRVYSINGSTNPDDWGTVPISNNTTWNEVVCNWNAKGFRLPTEVEWMYAANGGKNQANTTYSGSNDINSVAWYGNNSSNTTHDVKGKSSNILEIYDMTGNVYEWCWDVFDAFPTSNTVDYRGPSTITSKRIKKGGAWSVGSDVSTIESREGRDVYTRGNFNGFRVVLIR